MSLKNCLALLFVLAFLSFLVQSDFGNVNVKSHTLYSSNNQYVVYDLYKPSSASKENKAPFIVVVPGFQRSKEALSNIAIELSRRGNVVALIDPYAQGMSSSSLSRRAATTEGYGMFALIDTVSKGNLFDFVDTIKWPPLAIQWEKCSYQRCKLFWKGNKRKQKSKLHSVYVSGYVLTLTEKVLEDVRSNVGVSYALYDEGAFRNELQGWDAGNMKIAPEALRTVNSILDENQKLDVIELEKFYGEIDKNTARVIYNERLLHPFQPYNNIATANQLIYFDKVFNSDVKLDPYDQIWQWKELFTLLSMITSLIMLIPLTRFLLKLNFFSELVKEVPKPLPVQNRKGKVVFWSIFIIGATVACLTFIPMVDIAKIIFQKASNRELTWFFPQRMNNSVMLWATFNGVFGAILFFGSYHLFGRKAGIKKDSWGIKITNIEIVKTFLLGLLVFLIYYGTLNVIHFIFHVDYRFWFMGVRIFQPQMVLVLAMYFPFFFVFFLSNSLRVNGAMRFENQPEWISRLVAGLANSSGLIMIIVIQYFVFLYTGSVFWTTNWLSVNLLFGIVPMMFFLPYFNRVFFEMTGRIYLGPVIKCLIFIMILSTNTVVYLPI